MHQKVIIFTECGTKIGYGHLSRCCAIYDEVIARGILAEIILDTDISAEEIVGDRQCSIFNWIEDECSHLFSDKLLTYSVVDSYLAKIDKLQELYRLSEQILFLDDDNRIIYPKGIVIQPSLSQRNEGFGQEGIVLYGKDYIILREPFQQPFHRNPNQEVNDVLVIIGGTDVRKITESIVKSLCEINTIRTIHVIGNLDQDQVKQYQSQFQGIRIICYSFLNPQELRAIMEKSDCAISGGGQTILELIITKLPFVCIKVADNQLRNINAAIDYGVIDTYLDIFDQSSFKLLRDSVLALLPEKVREKQIHAMNDLLDGHGTKRIIDALLQTV